MDIFHDMMKYYIQLLSELNSFVKDIRQSDDILQSLLSPKGYMSLIFLAIAIILALFAIKMKKVALGSILVVVVYSLLKHFKNYTNPYAIPIDNMIRRQLPSDIMVIFGDQSHHAIGFLCISVAIVILLMFIKNTIYIAIVATIIFLGYKMYIRYLKEVIGSDNRMLEFVGVAAAVLVLMYFFYWIFDIVLAFFFALLGNSILLVYTSAIFNSPENYIDFLTKLSEIQAISELKDHPMIVFLILPALLFFMVQKRMFVK